MTPVVGLVSGVQLGSEGDGLMLQSSEALLLPFDSSSLSQAVREDLGGHIARWRTVCPRHDLGGPVGT